MDLTLLFCNVDDFYKEFFLSEPTNKVEDGKHHRNRNKRLSPSEIMTILIYFHASGYRNFKHFYINHVLENLNPMFPGLLSYNRFVAITPTVLLPMCSYLFSRFDEQTGISYIDTTKIQVCGNKRISRNKVFKGLGKVGKTTMGWFFGFKLHLIINEKGGLLAVKVTTANVDDRSYVPEMSSKLLGKIFGDKGYISKKLFEELFERGLQLITTVKKNMKNKLMPMIDKVLLRKRSIIETVNDQLKNISQIEHSRHRSIMNFMVNLLCGLLAYTFQEKKPCISGINELRDMHSSRGLLA